jgi:hypothetical protein
MQQEMEWRPKASNTVIKTTATAPANKITVATEATKQE